MKSCNWCGSKTNPFVKDKPYCTDCGEQCARECVTCHKPYPNEKRFSCFSLNDTRCNSCERRNVKRKLQRKLKTISEENNARHFSGESERPPKKIPLDGEESDKSLTDEENLKLDSDGDDVESAGELSNDEENHEPYNKPETVFERMKMNMNNLKRAKEDEEDGKKKRKYPKRGKKLEKTEVQENLLRAVMDYQSKFPKKSSITISM